MWSISTAYSFPRYERVLKGEARTRSRREPPDEEKARRGKQNQQRPELCEGSLEIDTFQRAEPEP